MFRRRANVSAFPIRSTLEPNHQDTDVRRRHARDPRRLAYRRRPNFGELLPRFVAETVNGRATMKYRVTLKGKTGAGNEITTESLVWVDENLGMPVKSEMTSTGNGASGTHVTMELRDIKETVDSSVFELPPDYRKVEARDIFAQLKQTSPP